MKTLHTDENGNPIISVDGEKLIFGNPEQPSATLDSDGTLVINNDVHVKEDCMVEVGKVRLTTNGVGVAQ